MTKNVFDMINDISLDKTYTFNEDTRSMYNPYLVNRAFMQHIDTVMYAVETNKMVLLDKEMHHDFLFYGIDPKKRYGKWAKADTTNDQTIKNIMNKYQCNRDIAIGYYKLMTEEQLKQFEKEEMKGGRRR